MKIVVIDDDPDIISTLQTFFSSEGHQVFGAETAEAGRQLVLVEMPELVFVDIRLPDKDGIDLLKELKTLYASLPIVVITAYKDAEKVVTAFRAGAFDCLLKPFNFDYLRNNILARVPRRSE